MIQVTLYSRKDCHLCHVVQSELERLQLEYPHILIVLDVDSSPSLERQYGEVIPVVEIGALTLKTPISNDELRLALMAASQQEHMQKESALATSAQPVEAQSVGVSP